MTITGSISAHSSLQQTLAGIPGAQPLATSIAPTFKVASPAGVAGTANNVDLKYARVLSLAATPTVLDLTSLLDAQGNALSFARVRSILVVNLAVVDGQVIKQGYATTTANAWTALVSNPGQLTIGPSTAANAGFLLMTAPNATGWAVTSTNKLLQLDPGAVTIAAWVEITGCSA